jgi:hypothetical protein
MSFETDIKPLFREFDRDEMRHAFDLWSHREVSANAESIMERLEAGDMPCDEPWSEEQVDRFRDWIDAGMPP